MLSADKVSGVEHGLTCKEKILAETGDRQRVVVVRVPGRDRSEGRPAKGGRAARGQ